MTLIEVRLLDLPLDVHRETAEHGAEVLREFRHLAEPSDQTHAPARLIALTEEIIERFGPFTGTSAAELDDALARGDATVDLTFRVPAEVAAQARHLSDVWDEVDRYCEEGRYVLALQTPPVPRSYRRWFLSEFSRQIAGEPPTSWTEWVERGAGA